MALVFAKRMLHISWGSNIEREMINMKSLATHGDTVRSCKCLSFPSKSTIISCRQFSNQADVGDEKPRTNIEYAITPSDLYQMNSTLSKLGHAGKIKEMLAVFDEFQTKWRELTSVQYNLVIHYSSLAAITRADPNYLDISRQYYREIKRRKLKITTQTFGTFLTALHSFQQYEEFISVIEFKKKHLPLNMIDYNSLFDVYTKLHKYNDLELNLQEMKSKAPLTIETYRILAKAYVQSKDERKLRDLIQEVSEKFGRLDKSIISIIIAQYLNSNDITKALEVFEKAKANQLVDRVTYNQFIKWFIENDTLRSAMGWYKKLKESNIPPSNDTWTILLWGSARLKIFKYVDSILEDMKGSPIDHKLHNATIHTLGMAGRIKDMEDYISKIKAEGFVPSASTYKTLCKVYSISKLPQKLREIKEEMEKNEFGYLLTSVDIDNKLFIERKQYG